MPIWQPGDLVQSYITGHWYQLLHMTPKATGWVVRRWPGNIGGEATFVLPRKCICARSPVPKR